MKTQEIPNLAYVARLAMLEHQKAVIQKHVAEVLDPELVGLVDAKLLHAFVMACSDSDIEDCYMSNATLRMLINLQKRLEE